MHYLSKNKEPVVHGGLLVELGKLLPTVKQEAGKGSSL